MRVGVIGAGVMGTNHARVLRGLPNTTLIGIVHPLVEHRARANGLACPRLAGETNCSDLTPKPCSAERTHRDFAQRSRLRIH